MKLRKWLDQKGLTNRALAKMIGASEAAVSRWTATGDEKRIPRKEFIESIEYVTFGKVKAQDFYS